MIIQGDEPIIIIRKSSTGSVDDYGNPVKTTEQILVRHALFAYNGSHEPVEIDRDPVDAKLTLYLPAGTEIRDGDIFEIRDTQWVKDGDAQDWPQLWPGFIPDVVVNVRRRRG